MHQDAANAASEEGLQGILPLRKTDRPGFRRADRHFQQRAVLGEVVADVAEDVLELTAQEDHGDDDSDGDDSNDECVLHQALAFVVTEECEHRFRSLLSSMFDWWITSRPLMEQ
jgi:hypothetical protein